jgi:hypothetical protein
VKAMAIAPTSGRNVMSERMGKVANIVGPLSAPR